MSFKQVPSASKATSLLLASRPENQLYRENDNRYIKAIGKSAMLLNEEKLSTSIGFWIRQSYKKLQIDLIDVSVVLTMFSDIFCQGVQLMHRDCICSLSY